MGRKDKSNFWSSAISNDASFLFYYYRLLELCISRFKWINVPNFIDVRYLELVLFSHGRAILFNDKALGYLSLAMLDKSTLDQYGLPTVRQGYGVNGYHSSDLTDENSVIVFNNMLKMPSLPTVEHYAALLWDIDRTIAINVRSQKTPIFMQCEDNELLTVKNLYKKYDGNEPVIFANKSLMENPIKVLRTDAPLVAPELNKLKADIWNEALTVLGISNIRTDKKERLLSDEVNRMQGGVVMSRNSALESRKNACKRFNDIFGENLQVVFNDIDYQATPDDVGGDDDGGIYNND